MHIFIYDWATVKGSTIYIYGLTPDSETCCIVINDFSPRLIIELCSNMDWNSGSIGRLNRCLVDKVFTRATPIDYKKVKYSRLYYAKMNEAGETLKYPFLKFRFDSTYTFRDIKSQLSKPLKFEPCRPPIKLTVHEAEIPIDKQFMCEHDIPSAGWVEFTGIERHQRETSCVYEYIVKCTDIHATDFSAPILPLVLSFDIETNSENPNAVPSPYKPEDCIFQISCVYTNYKDIHREYLLTLGNPDPKVIGENVITQTFSSEFKLLKGFIDLFHSEKPVVITGYNILGFDLRYLIGRAKHNRILPSMVRLGLLKNKECLIQENKNKMGMEQTQLKTHGRIWIDLQHMAQRDFKLPNYKLDTVAEKFLGANKDPVPYQEIFRAYREGVKTPTEEGVQLLSVVGAYCVKDSVLVGQLFKKWDVWVSVMEMANVCSVLPSTVFTTGQQSKVFAQVYRYCVNNQIVIDNTDEMTFVERDYTGAHVIDPVPGIYENVVPFDFTSLYPTIIVAYNIDYSTLVPDNMVIPDDKCNIIEWEEHVKCEHCYDCDTTSKKYRCQRYYFRFLKSPIGVLPAIIQNLLDLRKRTKKTMKSLSDEDWTKALLDKRQLSYKISANSMYGALGASPQKAILPFVEGAMSITAKSRQHLGQAIEHLQTVYKANLIYGDTDSCYVQFPWITDREELWNHCEKVSENMEIQKVFPSPMKLAFEEKIFADFLIIKKKKYMWKLYNPKTQVVEDSIGKKGVLTARRDNSEFVRAMYEKLVEMIFNRDGETETLQYIFDYVINAFLHLYPQDQYVTTSSVRDKSEYKSIPAAVILADKMRERGVRVDAGQRIEYVITEAPGLSDKMRDKVEDVEYQAKYGHIVCIDYLEYTRKMCAPIDQLLEIAFGKKKMFTQMYNLLKMKSQQMREIRNLFKPVIEFKE